MRCLENLFISKLNEKDVDSFTSDFGLMLRRLSDTPFKKACNKFTKANIIRNAFADLTDEEYFSALSGKRIPVSSYPIEEGMSNIVLERYPQLEKDEPYIFVCNHTCPEDIETVLNIIDRNAYLVLGSIDTLKHNPEAYLLWLNGVIPFDILDEFEKSQLIPKMDRVLATNSVLIFFEGSHNYHPNKLINNPFDGFVNSAMHTKRNIVPITLMRDEEKGVSYIDVGNPIDVFNLDIKVSDYYNFDIAEEDAEKYFVKSVSSYVRDKMATSVYYMMLRHFPMMKRSWYEDIGEYFRNKYKEDAFTKLKWNGDIFDAEYLVKKTDADKEYEAVVRDSAAIQIKRSRSTKLRDMVEYELAKTDYLSLLKDIEDNDVSAYMRDYWLKSYKVKDEKKLTKN